MDENAIGSSVFAPWAVTYGTVWGKYSNRTYPNGFEVGQEVTLPLNDSPGLGGMIIPDGFTAVTLRNGEDNLASYYSRLAGSGIYIKLISGTDSVSILRNNDLKTKTSEAWSEKIVIVPLVDEYAISGRFTVRGFVPFRLKSFRTPSTLGGTVGDVTCTLLSGTWTGGKLRWGTKPKQQITSSLVSIMKLYDSNTTLRD